MSLFSGGDEEAFLKKGWLLTHLELCTNCKNFVHQGTQTCPFCNEDIALSKQRTTKSFDSQRIGKSTFGIDG